MTDREQIYVATRTGRKLHKAWRTSSVTHCGHWLRVQASSMEVKITDPAKIKLVLCEHCFSPSERLIPTEPIANPREMDWATLIATDLTEGTDQQALDARHQARYLLRTMSIADLFTNIGRFSTTKPRLAKIVKEIVAERSAR